MTPFNNIPQEDYSDKLEIQLAYEINFSVDNVVDEETFVDAVCDVIGPSNQQVLTPYGEYIEFYSANMPENFDADHGVFNYYVHFQVDKEWFMNTDRNNLLYFFHSLKDVAIIQDSPDFMIGNVRVNIINIKLDNILFPYKDEDEFGELDCECF